MPSPSSPSIAAPAGAALAPTRSRNALAQLAPPRGGDEQSVDLRRYLHVLLAHRWHILAITLACTLAATLYALLARPVYETNMLIHVEEAIPNGSKNILNDVSSLFDTKKAAIAEMELLHSRSVIAPAVARLRLTIMARPRYLPGLERWLVRRRAPLAAPGLFGHGGYGWGGERIAVSAFEVPPPLYGHTFLLTLLENGRYRVDGDGEGEAEAIAVSGRVGVAQHWRTGAGEFALTVDSLAGQPGNVYELRRVSQASAVEAVQRALTISEQGRQSGVIAVRLLAEDAALAQATLTEIGREYLRQNLAHKTEEAEKSLAFLNTQMPELKRQLEQSEERYSQFRNAHGTVDLNEEARLSLQQVAAARQRRVELEQKRAELLTRYTVEHPIVQGVAAQLRGVDHELQAIGERISKLPGLEQDAARMSRDIKVNTELYTALLNTAQQLRIVAVGKVNDVRLVDAPALPERPLRPNRPLLIAGGGAAGLLLGLFAALLADRLHGGIDDPRRLEQLLGASVVYATIPHSGAQARLNQSAGADGKVALLAQDWPEDAAVEALRALRTALQFSLPQFKNNIVMLSSPMPAQGKSFLSSNLAAVVAASGKRVLLIDADLRGGNLQQVFGVARAPGLSEGISGAAPLARIIHRSVLPNLDFIATGGLPSGRAEFLTHVNFAALLAGVSAGYDLVLLDPPPVLAVADALIIGAHAGAVFLVLRAGACNEAQTIEAIRRLNRAGATPHGVVFNDLKLSLDRYGYRYRYDRIAELDFVADAAREAG